MLYHKVEDLCRCWTCGQIVLVRVKPRIISTCIQMLGKWTPLNLLSSSNTIDKLSQRWGGRRRKITQPNGTHTHTHNGNWKKNILKTHKPMLFQLAYFLSSFFFFQTNCIVTRNHTSGSHTSGTLSAIFCGLDSLVWPRIFAVAYFSSKILFGAFFTAFFSAFAFPHVDRSINYASNVG